MCTGQGTWCAPSGMHSCVICTAAIAAQRAQVAVPHQTIEDSDRLFPLSSIFYGGYFILPLAPSTRYGEVVRQYE